MITRGVLKRYKMCKEGKDIFFKTVTMSVVIGNVICQYKVLCTTDNVRYTVAFQHSVRLNVVMYCISTT